MSNMAIGGGINTAYTQQTQDVGKLPQIIDVKTGEGTDRAGFTVTTSQTGATSGIDGTLTPSQEKDLEALLSLLGLEGEDAKNATMQTVLKAVQKMIHQQEISVTTCTTAISDYDVTRLNALKQAMEPLAAAGDANAQKIIDNVNRMMELKTEIEALAAQGMVYDGKFEGVEPNPNFELNTRVREMGDRIADIRYYNAHLGGEAMDKALDSLAPAMKTAVKDLLDAYNQTQGWGVQVNISYSLMTGTTLKSFVNAFSSSDIKFPPQVSKDAFLQILKELVEELGPNATGEQISEKLEEKM